MKLPRLFAVALLLSPTLAIAAKDDPDAVALGNRLAALQANPDTAEVARYERLRAQQAITDYVEGKRRDRDELRFLADRRVEIAEVAAQVAAARRELEQVENSRNALLIEASRREAARARQEAERLRMQSQMQAEEAERLRQQADAELLARQDAEQALSSVASRQAAKMSDAQRRAAQLAREEAELTSGAKLPSSRFESRGEIFTLSPAAFDAAQSALSAEGASQAKALADYLQIGRKGRLIIIGYGGDASARKRGEALRDALVAAGVSAGRFQVSSTKGAAAKRGAVELVILP